MHLDNFIQESKPIILAISLHLIMIAGLFSFQKAAVEISNYSAAGSFNMVSFAESSDQKQIEKKIIAKPVIEKAKSEIAEKKIAKSIESSASQTSQNNNSSNLANSSSEVIYDAKNLGNPQPQYPLLAKKRGEEGTVMIRAFIDEKGAPSKIEIFKSSSFSLLDNAAVKAIEKWQFIPAKKFGQYISSSVIIPITFKLNQVYES
jgi:protein TonB